MNNYETTWTTCLSVLESMRGLKDLDIDINGLFCPVSCCRMLDCFQAIVDGLGHKELNIRIKGQIIKGKNATMAAFLDAIGPAQATALDE